MRFVRLATALLVLAALTYTLDRIEWARFAEELRGARLLPLLGSFALVVWPLAVRGLRAFWLLRRVGYSEVPFARVLAVTIFGFSLSSVTPGGSGDLMRVAALRPHGVSARACAALVVFERMLDVGVVLIFFAVSLLVARGSGSALIGAGVAALLLAALVWALPRLVGDPARFAARLPARFEALLPEPAVLRHLVDSRTVAGSLGFTILVFIGEFLRPGLCTQALDLEIGVAASFAVFTMAWLAGLASLLPLGVGSWETAAIWGFGLYGIEPAPAAAASLVMRVGLTLPTLFFGLLAYLAHRFHLLGLVSEPIDGECEPPSRDTL